MKPTVDKQINRRELFEGGLLLGVAAFIAGCAGTRQGTLPDPVWPTNKPIRPATPVATTTRPAQPTDYYGLPSGVLPRSQWTNQGIIKGRLTDNGSDGKMGKVLRITIHHDAIDSSGVSTKGDAIHRLNQVRNGHVNRRNEPFADIGYHFIIDPAGRIWEGRSLTLQGAHVKGQNENNLGVMVMGHFDRQRPTAAAVQSLDQFVASQMHRYGIPLSRVKTHQEMAPTECPGRNLQRYMLATRARGGNLARA
ncbi:hypothetical protein PHYC_03100 [Phycisphaerales bacterium]|nr:hypothetical protein PHYC_03100 [Phycisphaerales bacterium]